MAYGSMAKQQSGAEEIARLCLHDPNNFGIQLSQTNHRLQILHCFPISLGSRVLEIGCGQGDATAVLAELVGEFGHITAVDPADLSYGMYMKHLSYPLSFN